MQNNMGLVNIGDHIQSCAAEQFLPFVDFYVQRDGLNNQSYDKAKIIMNGWFTEAPQNWPPNPNLQPLFVAFHLQPSKADILLSSQDNVDYLKTHGPIGCRDFKTVDLLKAAGVDSYFSFCLTTTLDINYRTEENSGEILLVDPLYSFDVSHLFKMSIKEVFKKISLRRLKKLNDYFKPKPDLTRFIPETVIQQGVAINHYVDKNQGVDELYNIAKGLLKRYARAKVVVTSRIHCALPCLALRTPVLFVLDGLEDESQHMSRFRGILNHINILTFEPKEKLDKLFGASMNVYHPDDIDWNNPPENPETFIPLAENLKKECTLFIANE
jgi:hypothetical protein